MEHPHKYRMGLIGNCSYMAHIDDSADVVWMCWPGFDSSFIFGGLLDGKKGGHFWVRPAGGDAVGKQYYLENTNILCTEFECPDGKFRVIDFAPRFRQYERYFKPSMLIRIVEPIQNHPKVRVACGPVGEYGRIEPEVNHGSNHIRFAGLEKQVRLTSSIPLSYILEGTPFVLNERKVLVLTWGTPLEAPLESTADDFLRKTTSYWRGWVLGCTIGRFHQAAVIRSALAVKLHQFDDTGAIVASATMGLPEAPGSGRTWDYRYCWLRDSYYTLASLNLLGQFEELEKFAFYVLNIAASEQGRYNPVYRINGSHDLAERHLDLAGYLGNQPVRLGNQAATHVQNDLYGQLLVSLLPLYVDQRFTDRHRYVSIELINRLLSGIERTMDEADAGLWEFRNLAQQHCYTFLFHWAGANAAQCIGRDLGYPKMVSAGRELARLAREKIEACYDPDLGAYTQAIGTKNLDASLLQLITMGYLDPASERARDHLCVLERKLRASDALFYRYRHSDDFGVPTVTFLVCAFWYVDALAAVGRLDDAIAAFESLIGYANPLGLLSEDVDAATGAQWGNFPQVYSHVGLIHAAHRIDRGLQRPDFLAGWMDEGKHGSS